MSVPASEKVVSIFEEHTDVIVKGQRDVQYGYKINLNTVEKRVDYSFIDRRGKPK